MKQRQDVREKAKVLVDQMTLKEKIYIMSANETLKDYLKGYVKKVRYNEVPYVAGGVERLGIPPIRFCDGPRGVDSGSSTCFPVSMARGATFNPALEEEVGIAIGEEVRAHGANFFAGVCINLPYNPGDGRSQETYGEDSYHLGEMGAALVRGVQSQNVAACIKHYAFNSMENSRFKVDVTANKRTEREVFLPHFKRCLDEGALALMSSYNKYQGTYCGHHRYLLRDVAKGEWGFEGPVMSDFLMGVRDTVEGITGGQDIEMRICRVYSYRKVKKALDQKKISIDMINEAAVRIVEMLLMLQDETEDKKYPASLIASEEHTELARRVAEEGITLIKNDGMLPLQKEQKIVLLGDLADEKNIGDHGSSCVNPPYVVTLTQAMKNEYSNVSFIWVPTSDAEESLSLLREADAVVAVCGLRHCDEGEFMPQKKTDRGGDRSSLSLHEEDLRLIELASRSNRNTAVVLMGGNAIMMHDWKDKVKAIVMAYYPGMEGGNALARILMGDVNPSGKLPFVIATDEKDYPRVNWDTDHQFYDYYHGYRKLDKEEKKADVPFGYGLSYTSFELKNPLLISSDEEEGVFEVTVKNTGERDGAEVVQLYVGFPDSLVDRPIRTLAAFEKVWVGAKGEKTVQLTVKKDRLGWYDEKTGCFVQDTIYEAYIGNSEHNTMDPIAF